MRYKYKDTRRGCVGSLTIPTEVGSLSVAVVGDSRADALGKAALIAERIATDPVMSALMPPQALAAIKAAKGLAAAAKRGTRVLRSFWGRIHGPGKKRLAEALHEEAAKEEASDVGWNPFKRKRKKPTRTRTHNPPPAPRGDEQADEQTEEPEEQGPDESSDVGGGEWLETGDAEDVNGGES